MATIKLSDKRTGKEIGTIDVYKHGIDIRPAKKLRLKRWVKVTLGVVAVAAACAVTVFAIGKWADNQHDWYQECDQAYGYTTDYYTCRNYHIRGGK